MNLVDAPLIRLLFRGDDAGTTCGTNQALSACARGGMVRNIGIMACAPAFDHAAECFRDPLPGVVLGLHATVTSEWTSSLRWGPVLPRDQVPTLLASDGNFVRSTQTLHESANHDQIIAEVRAQIARARTAGLDLTYLDTHMVFNWLPGIHDRLESLAAAEGLIMDHPNDAGITSLPAAPLDTLIDRIAALPTGTIHRVVFHPSTYDDDARLMFGQTPGDSVARSRQAETDWLTDPTTAHALAALPVQFITYSDLG